MTTPTLPSTQHLDKFGFLVGYPIAHSFSPLFHQTIFDTLGLKWQQLLYESTELSDFLKLLKDPKFFGTPPPVIHHHNSILTSPISQAQP